jgi:hypothetical protein
MPSDSETPPRAHGKRASLLSDRGSWIAVLFIVGSACFAIGPFPGFVQLVGAAADAAVFFAGSLFFTTAAALQLLEAINDGGGRLASLVQLAGTLFFNLSTYDALREGLSTGQENRLIWAPDVFGCVCFLVASGLAWVEVRGGPRREAEWRVAALNLTGSVAFGIAGAASYVVPDTGDVLALAAANFTTVIGALCFLAGAVGLLGQARRARIPRALVPAGG